MCSTWNLKKNILGLLLLKIILDYLGTKKTLGVTCMDIEEECDSSKGLICLKTGQIKTCL